MRGAGFVPDAARTARTQTLEAHAEPEHWRSSEIARAMRTWQAELESGLKVFGGIAAGGVLRADLRH